MVNSVTYAAATGTGTNPANVLNNISNNQLNTGNGSNTTTTSTNTNGGASTGSSGAKRGADLEATMKQQVSARVGDGKNGQYATQKETAQAVMDKYKSLKGEARAKFVEDMAAIGKPLGLDFGLKDKAGKPLNQGVELVGDAKEAAARLWREFAGIAEPVAKASAAQPAPAQTTPAVETTPTVKTTDTPAEKATDADIVDTSDKSRLKELMKGLAAMDKTKDGRLSADELTDFALQYGVVSQKPVDELDTFLTGMNGNATIKQAADLMMQDRNKNTDSANKIVEYGNKR